MLIRWMTPEEQRLHQYEGYGPYDVLAAQDYMTGRLTAALAFDREKHTIEPVRLLDPAKGPAAVERLLRCAENQVHPKGNSFHYRYPDYARAADPAHCPACNHLPMPENMEDIAVLPHSFVSAEPQAQGMLFGKCHVMAKHHGPMLYDLPPDDMAGFMADVQKTARALQAVTGAVKINYEIHCNSGPHLHCHLFPRYLDDAFPSAPIDYRITEPSPYESAAEYRWFIESMREALRS